MQQHELEQGFRIGDIVVEPPEGTLTRADGETVHLEPKVMQVLLVLAEGGNRTVARGELLDRVWNGQAPADELLTRAVSELRRAFNDDSRNPAFIRTVPKRGYRLLGAVEPMSGANGPSATSSGSRPPRRLPPFGTLAAVTAALLLVAFLATSDFGDAPPDAPEPNDARAASASLTAGRPVPLTSMDGYEWGPALSPDGRYAAFVSSPPGQFSVGNIYVVEVGSAMPVPLTTDTGVGNRAPTWSPDGTRIAFARLRDDGRADIVVKPVLGGFERKLATIDSFSGHDWSPDGDRIAVSIGQQKQSDARIYLLSVNDSSLVSFTAPSNQASDIEPRFSPDGSLLAFARWSAGGSGADLCIQPLDGSDLRCITPNDKQWQIRDLDWAPDGESLIVSVDGLMRVPLSGGPVEPLPFGDDSFNVSLAANGNRLVYEDYSVDSNLWRVPGPAAPERGEPERFISSTRAELSPRYSPDGSQIAFVSGRSGGREVWVADAEGRNPRRLTEWGNADFPDWSPDGQMISFSSGRYAVGRGEQAPTDVGFDPEEAFLVEASGGVPRMISDGESGARAPSWSHDGRFVFFTRGFNDCGSEELWRRHLESGKESLLADCAWRPLAGKDGRVYYFDKHASAISSVPANGGDVRQEVGGSSKCYRLGSAWTVWNSNLIYVDCDDLAIRMLNLDTRETVELAAPLRGIELFANLSLDVSPDGRWMVFSRVDRAASDLILIEPFL